MLHSDTTAEYAESRHGQRNAFVRVVRNCPYSCRGACPAKLL